MNIRELFGKKNELEGENGIIISSVVRNHEENITKRRESPKRNAEVKWMEPEEIVI